jgi:hypothetical protein
MAKQPTNRATTQTTRINGARVVIKTTASGKVTVKPAAVLEWQLQSAQVRALRQMPEYGKLFLLAGDMNAAKRGATATAQAIASGMTPGEPDLRVYLLGGRIGLIENKVGNAALTESQEVRHPALAKIGHPVTVIRAVTEEDAAAQAVALVRGWLAVDMAQNAATLACGAISAQK